jgi:serine/threonine protein phosphatase PrpC
MVAIEADSRSCYDPLLWRLRS